MSSGRLLEVKNNRKIRKGQAKKWPLTRGGRLREVPDVKISLRKFWYFGKMIADGRSSLTRGDCLGGSAVVMAVHKMLGNFWATFPISGKFSNFEQLFQFRATSSLLRPQMKTNENK